MIQPCTSLEGGFTDTVPTRRTGYESTELGYAQYCQNSYFKLHNLSASGVTEL